MEENVLSISPLGQVKILEKDKDYCIDEEGLIRIINDKDHDGDDIHLASLHTRMQGQKGTYINAGKIVCCNEQGRATPGRTYQHGLHQAIEAKEGVMISARSLTYASITTQEFYKLYAKLSGMTATPEESEFSKVYNLETSHIPTHLPFIRREDPSRLYKEKDKKLEYVMAETDYSA